MASAAPVLTPWQRLLDVPEHLVGEILAGELHVSPRPAPRHANAATTVVGDIHGPYQRGRGGPGGWLILVEPELHLPRIGRSGPDVLVPDVAGWLRTRMAGLPEEAAFELAPDWVLEVVSPSTGRRDRTQKMPIYLAAGVSWLWLVDPAAQTLESYRRVDGRWTLLRTWGGHDRFRAEPFSAVELRLADLWDEIERPPPPA